MRPTPPDSASAPATLARVWLFAGLAILVIEPGARLSDPVCGWLPYWLVVAPVLVLLQYARGGRIASLLGARVRRRRAHVQAVRRSPRGRSPARVSARTAPCAGVPAGAGTRP